MRQPVLASALLLATLTTGCHGRYKRQADSLGKVALTVAPAPEAEVVGWDGEATVPGTATGLVELGVGIASIVVGTKIEKSLQEVVVPEELAAGLESGLWRGVAGEDLPYAVADKGENTLEVEIVGHGLDVTEGAPLLFVHVRAKLLDAGGKRIYRGAEYCQARIGGGEDVPLTGVDELVALAGARKNSPERMAQRLLKLGERCGLKMVEKLEKDL